MTTPGEPRGRPSAIKAMDNPDAADFIQALRERRVVLQLTQEEVAARLGLKRSTLGFYERGHTAVLPRLLTHWAAALDMDIVAVARSEEEDS